MKHLLLATTIALFSLGTVCAQSADPAVNISVNSPVTQGSSTTLSVSASNLGSAPIVTNSLQITVTVGNNLRITGLTQPSDSRWTVFSATTGNGNTYTLRNTAGSVASFDGGDIRLTVLGANASLSDAINANIAYVSGTNPNLPGNAPNNSQGNGQTNNDTSSTTLVVTPSTALATRLTSFTGTARQCDAALSWQMINSDGTTRYELQSSPDGQTFTVVEGQTVQTGSDKESYGVVVPQKDSKRYYRLKLTGVDGAIAWSQTVRVLTNCNVKAITCFPNPVSHGATISGIIPGDVVTLYNRVGQQLQTITSTGTRVSLDMQGLAAGTYQIIVTGADTYRSIPVLKVD